MNLFRRLLAGLPRVRELALADGQAELSREELEDLYDAYDLELERHKKRDDRKMNVLKKAAAMRVIFFYPGEEGTYVDNPEVTLYENGIVHIQSSQEETTTHLQNCEILWRFEEHAEDRSNKVRLLKLKSEARASSSESSDAGDEIEGAPTPEGGKPGRGPSKNN